MRGPSALAGGERGALLMDIVVALCLMGLVLVPLSDSLLSLARRAMTAESKAVQVQDLQSDPVTTAWWSWGPAVTSAAWTADGDLLVSFADAPGQPVQLVGVWLHGWFCGEHEVSGDGEMLLESRSWDWPYAAAEIVVRVRAEGTGWGPPWRILSAGGALGADPPPSPVGPGPMAGVPREAMVHLPAFGSSEVELTSGGVRSDPVVGPGLGRLEVAAGSVRLQLGELWQEWWAEEGRGVDAYF